MFFYHIFVLPVVYSDKICYIVFLKKFPWRWKCDPAHLVTITPHSIKNLKHMYWLFLLLLLLLLLLLIY